MPSLPPPTFRRRYAMLDAASYDIDAGGCRHYMRRAVSALILIRWCRAAY